MEARRTVEKLSFLAGDLYHVARRKEVWSWTTQTDEAGRQAGPWARTM